MTYTILRTATQQVADKLHVDPAFIWSRKGTLEYRRARAMLTAMAAEHQVSAVMMRGYYRAPITWERLAECRRDHDDWMQADPVYAALYRWLTTADRADA